MRSSNTLVYNGYISHVYHEFKPVRNRCIYINYGLSDLVSSSEYPVARL